MWGLISHGEDFALTQSEQGALKDSELGGHELL